MRVFLGQQTVAVTPGRPVTLTVDVTNTLPAIDGITARVVGIAGVTTASEPPLLPLFPDTAGRLVLTVEFPAQLPAGQRHALVEVTSAIEPDRPEHLPLEVDIKAEPAASITVVPAVGSGRHRARYMVMCDNTGNTPLEISLAATDPERAVRTTFEHRILLLGPGESAATPMTAKSHRHLLGGEISHALKILGSAHDPGVNEPDADAVDDGAGAGGGFGAAKGSKAPKAGTTAPYPGAGPEGDPTAPLTVVAGSDGAPTPGAAPVGAPDPGAPTPVFPTFEVEAQARFRQSPVIPSGVRTALVLSIIVLAWAGAFLFGLSKAFGSDPLTKEVPASFYAAAKVSPGGNALGLIAGLSADDPPAGAVPKTGVVEGVGGTINGTVLAASTGQGVGRITVQAVQDAPSGPTLVSSAATAADGTYSLVGLLPGTYKLNFTASGFQDQWYPDATSEAAASGVQVDAMSITAGIDATISGMPGSISGVVQTGQRPPPTVTVMVLPEQGTTAATTTVTTDATGHYNVPNLPTPGTYDLSFEASGFQAGSDVEVLDGGDGRIANTVTLTAGNGDIDGVVTDGTNPLGGVSITASANGKTVTSATPTSGSVGHFAISGLATPATYLLTFMKPGFGTDTVAVALGPGQVVNNLDVVLAGGTGTVSGMVSGPIFPGGPTGPLGGVTVTVNGGPAPVTTQTLTAGAIGSYVVSGLVTPGSYTVTFSEGGYAGQTLPVTLASNGSASGVDATLSLTVGVISGTVVCASPGVGLCPSSGFLSGVLVTATNGTSTQTPTTLTAGTPTPSPTPTSPAVTFALTGLPAGGYSVTFSLTGWQTQTLFVQLQPGQVVDQQVTLLPSSP